MPPSRARSTATARKLKSQARYAPRCNAGSKQAPEASSRSSMFAWQKLRKPTSARTERISLPPRQCGASEVHLKNQTMVASKVELKSPLIPHLSKTASEKDSDLE